MSVNEQEVAPVQLNEHEAAPSQATEAEHEVEIIDDGYPQTKSGVRNAREVVMQNAKFQKGDWVHMSIIANGSRSKGIFKIYAAVYNPAGWVDYTLMDPLTGMVRAGAVREKELKAGQ